MGPVEYREDGACEGSTGTYTTVSNATRRSKVVGRRSLLRDNLRRSQSSSSSPRGPDTSRIGNRDGKHVLPVRKRYTHRREEGDFHHESDSYASDLVQGRSDQAKDAGGTRERTKRL